MSKKTKAPHEHNAVYRAIDRWFCMGERGTNIKTEIFAGILMFLEVACMAAVSAQLITNAASAFIKSYTTVYFGIMLISVIGTALVGLLCNAPLIQSVSMGGVILIASTLSGYYGLTPANVLMIALIANGVYLLVTLVSPARRFFANAIPKQIKLALPAAMGAYLLIYALTQLNVFGSEANNFKSVLESMAAAGDALPWWGVVTTTFGISNAGGLGWYMTAAIITAVVGVGLATILQARKRKHAVSLAFLLTVIVYIALWVIRGNFMDYYYYAFMTPAYGGMYFYDSVPRISSEFNASLLFKSITEGMDFSKYDAYQRYLESKVLGVSMNEVTVATTGKLILIGIITGLSFLALGVSETAAGLHGSAYASSAYDETGEIVFQRNPHFGRLGKVLDVYSINALSSTLGCVLGAGPVMVRGESAVGGKEGGKTGLAALIAAVLCAVAIYTVAFSGLFMNGIAVFGILIFVALTLLRSFQNCDFTDSASALPFIVTVGASALTQNLGTAVLLGIVLDTVTRLFSGKTKEIHAGSYMLSVLAIGLYILTKI